MSRKPRCGVRAAAGTCPARDDGHARSRPACQRSWPTSVSPPEEPDAPAPAARPVPGLRVPGRVRVWLGHRRSQLSPDNNWLALLENAAATAAGLFVIILIFGLVSGGHFNPVVSVVDAHLRGLS
jgi:hypothetical protein